MRKMSEAVRNSVVMSPEEDYVSKYAPPRSKQTEGCRWSPRLPRPSFLRHRTGREMYGNMLGMQAPAARSVVLTESSRTSQTSYAIRLYTVTRYTTPATTGSATSRRERLR